VCSVGDEAALNHQRSNRVSMPAVQANLTSQGRKTVVALGVILLVLGFVLGISILWTLGIILLVIGVVFWILGAVGRPVGGRRYWW
jgi:Zn-dependent membrane protease YugP